MDLDELKYVIKGAFFEVYNTLGPGLLEGVYEWALKNELELRGLEVRTQVPVGIEYKGFYTESELRLDMIVENTVIVELKSVESGLKPIHFKQILTYLKVMDKPFGWLVNFDESDFRDGIKPVTNYSHKWFEKEDV